MNVCSYWRDHNQKKTRERERVERWKMKKLFDMDFEDRIRKRLPYHVCVVCDCLFYGELVECCQENEHELIHFKYEIKCNNYFFFFCLAKLAG
mmetsp:Transcript_478/g.632  ORF Transcript_478/g.632 Transcript_478/m.632 type:complete len:93 (-) Transcript_478:809-1087(-)